jgi:hypothetical protein
LENGERRIQRRLHAIFSGDSPSVSRLAFTTNAPSFDDGFLDALDDWRAAVAHPRLAIIDVLQRIKPPGHASRTAYENDYSIWAPL